MKGICIGIAFVGSMVGSFVGKSSVSVTGVLFFHIYVAEGFEH